MSRRERQRAAKRSGRDLNQPITSTPAALHEASLRHLQAGRYLDAQVCCQQALAIDGNHADTLHLMGLLSFHAQQYDLAVEWLARAVRQGPKAEYLSSLGVALQRLGRREEALKAFDKAVQLNPEDAGLWSNLGNILLDLGRSADALLSFQHALTLDPRHWDAAYKSGVLLYQAGRMEEAVACLERCDTLRPEQANTLQLRAHCLRGLKRFEEALADFRRAHALVPSDAETCNCVGGALQSLGRDEEALPWFDRALGLQPDLVVACNRKAFALTQLHRFGDAIACYGRARAIDPDNALAEWNLALLQMLTGNFEAGWAGREARWRAKAIPAYPEIIQPRWLGDQSIEGNTILVYADEGLGDSIQFARYLPMLADRGARVIAVVQEALQPLLSGLPGVSRCVPKSAAWNLLEFDVHCPISSLPFAFKTRLDTVPSATPYLPSPAAESVQAWQDRLGRHDRLRVGLVWSGSTSHRNDHNRSIPLQTLTRILDADATFVSLQKDPRPVDTATLQQRPDIVDLTSHLADFSETAALLSCLDLVITVDTSVAHLAGALGRPTWILLPYTPDYRWLLDRDDSPWYPTARLFRQTKTRDYASVVDRVRTELLALAASFKANAT